MRRCHIATFALATSQSLSPSRSAQGAPPTTQLTDLTPPIAEKRPHETHIHGYTLSDDYFWMRDRSNPAVLQHLDAENAYTTAVMQPTEALQQTLYEEMLGRIKQTDASARARKGAYLYYSRTEEGKQYPIYCRARVGSDAEEVLLDVNALAHGHGFYALGALSVSDDGNLLAFTSDTTGYRQYTLQVKDLRTGTMLPDHVERVGSVVWATDNRTLLLTTEDALTKRSDDFWRHTAGTNDTTLLYHEPDELFDVFAYRSQDRRMIFLSSAAKTMTEARYLPADDVHAPLTVVLPRAAGLEYDANYDDGRLYIRTNDEAKNFRVLSAPLSQPRAWTEIVAHDPDVKIDDVTFFSRYMVLSERENGLPFLRVIEKATGESHRIETPEPAYTLHLGTNYEYDVDTVQFAYDSLVTPPSTFEYDMAVRSRLVLKQQEVLGYDPMRYESQRFWATARDGTRVPVAIVYCKGTPFDGSAPLLLYAYGSYGLSLDATFSSNRLSLLDRGFIYALASIRGGGELGEEWREAGRMMQKMNTFTDFIDVAEYLVTERFTSPDRLMAQGGSAGGLLMGVVSNMRPDLFRAVDAQVPFVDIMNTMLDASLPLTTSEYMEWGNPNEKPAFDYMMRYSPYDNVTAQEYPAMLIEVSLNDSQVPYWEGAKWGAKLRAMKTDAKPVLVKANMGAGHGGASGRYDRLHEIAFEYAFFLSQVPESRSG